MSILGVGVDLLEVARVRELYHQFPEKFIARLCTAQEQQWLVHYTVGSEAYIHQLAKIFAAKEAVAKALGTGIGSALSFQDVETGRHPSGQPFAQVPKHSAITLHLSLSDTASQVIAMVVAESR